jgi:ankyrin repeat protein
MFRQPRYDWGWTPLTISCHHRLTSVIEALPKPILPEKAALLNLGQALGVAVSEGHEAVIRALIATGVSLDLKYFMRMRLNTCETAVYTAVAESQLHALQLLLQNGADASGSGGYGSALNLAASRGNEEQVRMLLEHNADTSFSDKRYGHPLLAAASAGHTKVVELILERGGSVGMRGRCERGCRAFEETHPLEEASFRGHTATLSSLLQAAVRDSVHEQYYQDAYSAASYADHVECVALIRAAAEERGFARHAAVRWNYEELSSSRATTLVLMSSGKITLNVKTISGIWISVHGFGHWTGLMLKQVIHDKGGGDISMYLIVRGSSRRIADEQRLCDVGVTDGCRIEQTLSFHIRTLWIDDPEAIQRALDISAAEARQRQPIHSGATDMDGSRASPQSPGRFVCRRQQE